MGIKLMQSGNITDFSLIPLEEDYNKEFNYEMDEMIEMIDKTMQFSCDVNRRKRDVLYDIHVKFVQENEAYHKIMWFIKKRKSNWC